jgi:rfaE bifunctional protein kinase chain/domain
MIDKILAKFQNCTILVVGDVMLDCYLRGKVTRISPEAPVPVLNVQNRSYRPGGAANVALNLKELGANPILCSVAGNDHNMEILKKALYNEGLTECFLLEEKQRITTVKYRLIGNQMQMMRVDDEQTNPISTASQNALLGQIEELLHSKNIQALIFVDYDKGVLNRVIIDYITNVCNKNNIKMIVDPKQRNFSEYKNVSLFKPNLREFLDGLKCLDENMSFEMMEQKMKDFSVRQNIEKMMITLSERGIVLYEKEDNKFLHQAAYKREISDVSGAGDTVAAIVSLCILSKCSAEDMLELANIGGGLACEQNGVHPISAEMLKREYRNRHKKQ